VRFFTGNFYGVLNSPYPRPTSLIKLVEAIIDSEPEPDEENRARVKWIYEHTHIKVDEHLSRIVDVVFRNIGSNVNKEIEIGNTTYTLIELNEYLDEVSRELSSIVVKIAKKYSLDMPMQMIGNMQGQNQQTISV